LIGKAFFLTKLEEVVQICAFVETDGQTTIKHPFEEVATTFDKRMGEIISQWRASYWKETY